MPQGKDAEFGRLKEAHAAVQLLLESIGEKPFRNGLIDTPQRVTKAWREMARSDGLLESAAGDAIFDLEEFGGDPGWVAVKGIPFAAISAETLLPYHGVCHVAYKIGRNKILGLSKAARIVQAATKGMRTQQQLVDLVKATIEKVTGSNEVVVISTATHIYYDRPLVVMTASSIPEEIKNNKEQTQSALSEYARQLYCATLGHREVPFTPTENGTMNHAYDVTDPNVALPIVSCTIDFKSLCEHHLLPFHGKIFIGCKSASTDEKMASLKLKESMMKKIWNTARRLQVQERLTNDMADVAMALEFVDSVIVVCEAVHLCMIARGARTHSSVTRTVTKRGDVPMELIQMTKDVIKL